jgi:hypothetical protein
MLDCVPHAFGECGGEGVVPHVSASDRVRELEHLESLRLVNGRVQINAHGARLV